MRFRDSIRRGDISKSRYVRRNSYNLSATEMHHIHSVCRGWTQHSVGLGSHDHQLRAIISQTKQRTALLTATPFKKNKNMLITSPGVPSTNCVTKPDDIIENGARKPALHNVARRRSSGTHTPPRRLRHFATTRSDSRPARGAPTDGGLVSDCAP